MVKQMLCPFGHNAKIELFFLNGKSSYAYFQAVNLIYILIKKKF